MSGIPRVVNHLEDIIVRFKFVDVLDIVHLEICLFMLIGRNIFRVKRVRE